jgi:hypothetical protein
MKPSYSLMLALGLVAISLLGFQASVQDFLGSEHLGNPTDRSIAINIVPKSDMDVYFQYGVTKGGPYKDTPTLAAKSGEPHEVVIEGLQPNTRYYYRMQYRAAAGKAWTIRDEHTFHTARPAGAAFVFAITADSHINVVNLGVRAQWQKALDLIVADSADFMLDLGDTFGMDPVSTAAAADAAYLFQRDPDLWGRLSHSVPTFLAIGNHENEEGWNFDDVNPQPIFSMKARKRYFPLPTPLTAPSFYSANKDPVKPSDVAPGNSHIVGQDQYRESYYAWEWGDALFVVFDPFEYTMQNPYGPGTSRSEGADDPAVGDRWNWTMGVEQHKWLDSVLKNSRARYKFLFAHHMVGGVDTYARGGAEAAGLFEWGGCNADAPAACVDATHPEWAFDKKRPAADGWIQPVHQMMQKYGVQIFFHGHDHQFVQEERDGITYQEVPSPSMDSRSGVNFYNYTRSPYAKKLLGNSGYLRVTVSPTVTTVDYVKSTGNNAGSVEYSYSIKPK